MVLLPLDLHLESQKKFVRSKSFSPNLGFSYVMFQQLCILMILDDVEQMDRIYVVTVDHGNDAEDIVKENKKGEPFTKDGITDYAIFGISNMMTFLESFLVPVAIGGPWVIRWCEISGKDVPSGGLAKRSSKCDESS
ncbi:2,3-bisphosphoglycerate-independent phosphoglycerate mutase [Tanacetum coccineum]